MHLESPAVGRKVAKGGLIALALVLGAILTGCGGSNGGSASTTSEQVSSAEVPEVTWGMDAADVAYNVLNAPSAQNVTLLANTMQGLLAYSSDGKLRPSLAESWKEVSPTVYTYKLRPGQRFSNGQPVRMEDVLYSMRNAMNPTTGAVTSSFYLSVRSIDPVGADTVKVTLRHPDPTWKYVPGHYSGWIYPKRMLTAAGRSLGAPGALPVGSGPYAIKDLSASDTTFVRNQFYGGTRPKVANVVVRFISDPATRLAAIESGDIDGTYDVPITSTPQWERVPTIHLQSFPSNGAGALLYFNTAKKPFDDPHVRRAMMYALDRETLTTKTMHGNATVVDTGIPPNLWTNEGLDASQVEARQADLGPTYPFDMDKAREELAASAYPDGFSASLIYNSAPDAGFGAQVLAASMQKLGVRLTLKNPSPAVAGQQLTSGTFQTFLGSGPGGYDFPDPLNFLNGLLCSCQIPPKGFNISRYRNPEMDDLIQRATAGTDADTRVDDVMQAVAIANRDVPVSFLWTGDTIAALNKKLVLTDVGTWSTFLTPWMASIHAAASS